MEQKISIVLPARNEAKSLNEILPKIKAYCPEAEILVVDDGSEDDTHSICEQHEVSVFRHPHSLGNGAAIKAGARAVAGDIIIFMDADGQHKPEDIPKLLKELDNGYDMVVGGRIKKSHGNFIRYIGNQFYNKLATWVTGHKITDLTSGFRVVKAKKFLDFVNILPNGFSYPTTITMVFFRVGYSVKYLAVEMEKDTGQSHINVFKDGVKFFLIIFRIAVLYSPLKIFFPVSLTFFFTGLSYYFYTFFLDGRFTNMGILLFITAVIIFLIGLISEQITYLIYLDKKK